MITTWVEHFDDLASAEVYLCVSLCVCVCVCGGGGCMCVNFCMMITTSGIF